MSQAAGFILRLSPERQKIFEERPFDEEFAEPVSEFNHSRNVPLICFIVNSSEQITHIAVGKRGMLAGTGLRRLNLEKLFDLQSKVSGHVIAEKSPTRLRSKLKERFKNGGLLPPKSFEALIHILSEIAQETAPMLRRYGEERKRRIASLPKRSQESLAEQKEAVITALSIAGINKDDLLGWDFEEDKKITSFLDGLEQVRLREDPMVINDLMEFPGHEFIKKTPYNSVVFENSQSKLTVILANRLPLEEQTGTDLIYYNETFSCFLMVQYKAMEQEDSEAVYRFPNKQLTVEISRMNSVLDELKKCSPNTEADGYRLSENPFFLKICPRIVFDPDNIGLVKGMYLPLDYWKLIAEHPTLVGPKGGKRLSYRNVRRYFDNSEFVALAAGGWVGTNTHQSSVLEVAIRSTLESGRAVIIAVNIEQDLRHRVND
jgi:hypothetical protein